MGLSASTFDIESARLGRTGTGSGSGSGLGSGQIRVLVASIQSALLTIKGGAFSRKKRYMIRCVPFLDPKTWNNPLEQKAPMET